MVFMLHICRFLFIHTKPENNISNDTWATVTLNYTLTDVDAARQHKSLQQANKLLHYASDVLVSWMTPHWHHTHNLKCLWRPVCQHSTCVILFDITICGQQIVSSVVFPLFSHFNDPRWRFFFPSIFALKPSRELFSPHQENRGAL